MDCEALCIGSHAASTKKYADQQGDAPPRRLGCTNGFEATTRGKGDHDHISIRHTCASIRAIRNRGKPR